MLAFRNHALYVPIYSDFCALYQLSYRIFNRQPHIFVPFTVNELMSESYFGVHIILQNIKRCKVSKFAVIILKK